MLISTPLWDPAGRMNIPLTFTGFKDQLEDDILQYSKLYIIHSSMNLMKRDIEMIETRSLYEDLLEFEDLNTSVDWK